MMQATLTPPPPSGSVASCHDCSHLLGAMYCSLNSRHRQLSNYTKCSSYQQHLPPFHLRKHCTYRKPSTTIQRRWLGRRPVSQLSYYLSCEALCHKLDPETTCTRLWTVCDFSPTKQVRQSSASPSKQQCPAHHDHFALFWTQQTNKSAPISSSANLIDCAHNLRLFLFSHLHLHEKSSTAQYDCHHRPTQFTA